MREKLRARWDSLVQKLSRRIPRLSRPWRVVRNLLCIPLTVYLIWLFAGGNPLSPQWAFRREETLEMVGPSEILCEARYRYYYSTDYIWFLGETEGGYTSMSCSRSGGFLGGWSGRLAYWPRGEEVTMVVREGTRNPDVYEAAWVYLLGDASDAVRAEVDITFQQSGHLNDRPYDFDRVYTVECTRNEEGILCGLLAPTDQSEDLWTATVEELGLGGLFEYRAGLPVTVRLYGSNGELLLQTSFEYRYAGPE